MIRAQTRGSPGATWRQRRVTWENTIKVRRGSQVLGEVVVYWNTILRTSPGSTLVESIVLEEAVSESPIVVQAVRNKYSGKLTMSIGR